MRGARRGGLPPHHLHRASPELHTSKGHSAGEKGHRPTMAHGHLPMLPMHWGLKANPRRQLETGLFLESPRRAAHAPPSAPAPSPTFGGTGLGPSLAARLACKQACFVLVNLSNHRIPETLGGRPNREEGPSWGGGGASPPRGPALEAGSVRAATPPPRHFPLPKLTGLQQKVEKVSEHKAGACGATPVPRPIRIKRVRWKAGGRSVPSSLSIRHARGCPHPTPQLAIPVVAKSNRPPPQWWSLRIKRIESPSLKAAERWAGRF